MSTNEPDGEGVQHAASSSAGTEFSIARDDAFHLLQNARRRAVLRYMIARDDRQFEMRTLAEEVAAWEQDTTIDDLTSSERQRVYIALYQSHLPKLDDYGVIEYDQHRGTVRPTPLLSAFEAYVGDGIDDDGDLSVESERHPKGVIAALTTLLNS